jgi:ATP-binding cassette subfamily B protein
MTALVSFDRVFEVLDLEPLVNEPDHPVPLPDGPLGISVQEVSFRYPSAEEVSLASLESTAREESRGTGALVLSDLSFTVAPGTMTALVGTSGAGKSTIISLLTRLYDPTSGSISFGDVDLREVSSADLRAAEGVVVQDAHMFHDTIRANLLYARPGATDADLRQACEQAQIIDMVDALPDGLGTVVGDRGYRLSGGEKQRIALARLLLKGPRVVILDEATAHLDSESERAVQVALENALAGRTSIVIAHRLSTIIQADQILVIDAGAVRESGTHSELLAANGAYADLYRTQFAYQENV